MPRAPRPPRDLTNSTIAADVEVLAYLMAFNRWLRGTATREEVSAAMDVLRTRINPDESLDREKVDHSMQDLLEILLD